MEESRKDVEYKIKEELEGLDFNSRRLEKRFVRTMETLSKGHGKSIWNCSENRAEAKAIYRMLGNERVSEAEVLKTHRKALMKRIKEEGKTILAIRDTTSLNYNGHKKTEGIGLHKR